MRSETVASLRQSLVYSATLQGRPPGRPISVERWPIDRLVPYARNARTHSDAQVDQIAASIREWGWTNPVLVAEDGTIIAGHGRVLAATSFASPMCRSWWRPAGPRRKGAPTPSPTTS